MKLEKALSYLNSFEKNSFLKIVDSIISGNPKNKAQIDKILMGGNDLKSIENESIGQIFGLVSDEFRVIILEEFRNTTSQLDILIDIISREGNSIMRLDWFSRLYEMKIKEIKDKTKKFELNLKDESNSEIDDIRKRDYTIYRECLITAYTNDIGNNQSEKITSDEQSILNKLASKLELSQEEVKLINYSILPIQKKQVDDVVNDLKNLGIIFFSKKLNTIYVPKEFQNLLRKIRGKEIADKFVRRILKNFKDSQINLIARKHGIDRKISTEEKVKTIITEGISIRNILTDDIHKNGTTLTEKKKFLNDFIDKSLKIPKPIKGVLIDEKVSSLFEYFQELENDEAIGISHDGYKRLIDDLVGFDSNILKVIIDTYQLNSDNVDAEFLLEVDIKPQDLLETIPEDLLKNFAESKSIPTRGDSILNIIEAYKDIKNLMFENFDLIASRDLNALKLNGIDIQDSELGVVFERITKDILTELGFYLPDELKSSLNTKKNLTDLIIQISKDEIIVVECKTKKDSNYNKFSSVSRQLKSYIKNAEEKGYRVIKTLLVAPNFSEDFVRDCGLDYELNLSLITAKTLQNILEGFRESKLRTLPYNLLMRDVVINENLILKAIKK
jgi:Holliday junction resolvase